MVSTIDEMTSNHYSVDRQTFNFLSGLCLEGKQKAGGNERGG